MRVALAVAIATLVLAAGASRAQSAADTSVAAAVRRFEAGDFEQAIDLLAAELATGRLGPEERSRARKYLGLSHIVLGHPDRAVEVFKELVREDPGFGMDALALGEEGPPPEVVRYFGQAILEWRREELRARDAQLRRTSRTTAFFRSAVLPGWGQHYQGYRGRSYVMAALTGGSLAWAAQSERAFRRARGAYRQAGAGAAFERLHNSYSRSADQADLALGLLGGAWLFNVLDAVLQGPNLSQPHGRPQARAGTGAGLQVVWARAF